MFISRSFKFLRTFLSEMAAFSWFSSRNNYRCHSGMREAQTRNLEIPDSTLARRPGMTAKWAVCH
jgi:hypothetical protein